MPKVKSPGSASKKKRKDKKSLRKSSEASKSAARHVSEDELSHNGPILDADGDPQVSDEEEDERAERIRLSKGVDGKSKRKKSTGKAGSDSEPKDADWSSLKGAEFDMSDEEAADIKPSKAEQFVSAAIGDDQDGQADSSGDDSDEDSDSDDDELDADREAELKRAVALRAESKKVSLFGDGDEDSDEDEDDDSDSDSSDDGPAGRVSGPSLGHGSADSDDDDESDDDEDEDGEGSVDEDGGAGAEDMIRRQGEGFEEFAERVERARKQEIEAAKAEMQLHTLGAESDRYHLPTETEMEEERKLPPDLEVVKERMRSIVLVLSDFKARREEGRDRTEYLERLTEDAVGYYGYSQELVELFLKIFKPVEALEFFEANEQPRPLTLRVNTLKARRKQVAQALINRGVNLDPLAQWSRDGLVVHESNIPIGATPEYLTGHYFIQSASSMMSVLALDPRPGERIIDVAAAPGGKTTHIAQLMRNRGALVANDPSPLRSRSLVANLARLGVTCSVASCLDGREIHKVFGLGSFDRVLLDAPCTGLGVIAKDPSVKTQKTYEDVKKMAYLQKQLCLAAVDAVDHNSPTGGIFVYSTCSVSVEENEAVVDYVLRKRKVKLVPVQDKIDVGRPAMPAYFHHRFHPSVKLARRFLPHVHNMDGFFVAKFRKIAPGAKDVVEDDGEDEALEGEAATGGAAAMEQSDSESAGSDDDDSDEDEEEEEEFVVRMRKGGKVVKELRRRRSRVSPSAADLRRIEEEEKARKKKENARRRKERKEAKRAAKAKARGESVPMKDDGEEDEDTSAAGGAGSEALVVPTKAGKKRGREQMESGSSGRADDPSDGAGEKDNSGKKKGKKGRKEKGGKKKKRRTESGADDATEEDDAADESSAADSKPSDSAAGTASVGGVLGKRVKGKKKRLATIGAGDAERAMGRKAAESAAMAVYEESEMQRLHDERKRTGADKLEAMGMRKATSKESLLEEARERADAILGEADASGSARAFKLKGKRKKMVKKAAGSSKAAAASTSSSSSSSSSSSNGASAPATPSQQASASSSDSKSSSGKKKKKVKSEKKSKKKADGDSDDSAAVERKRVSFGGQDVREFDKFMKPRAAGMDIDEARKTEGGKGAGKGKGKKGGKGKKKGGKRK